MSTQLSTNNKNPLDALKSLATNNQRKTVVSNSVAPQTIFLKVSEYLQNSQGEYAAKGVSVETGEELIISLFPAKEGTVRVKDLGNYANDPLDAPMSVGTAPGGGVIRFDNCFKQADGTIKSGYATMAVRNSADGVADFVRVHKSLTAKGGTTFDDNGVRVVCLDKRLIEQPLRESENPRENIVANILAEQRQNFIPIPVMATLLSQHQSEFPSLEQATSFLTKIGNANFALDVSLAKEYMRAGNGSYRASILDTKNAVQVTNAQEIRDALQMALKSPANDPSLAGKPGGYDAEAVIRVLASDNGVAGNSAVILNIKPTRQNQNDFTLKPLDEDLNEIMKGTKVSTLLTIMNEMSVKVEIIPMRTYLASSLGKKKLNAFSISQIIENSTTSDGKPIFAKELVSLRLFQKSGKSPFFLISTISPVSEESLNMSKSTLEMLTTKNIMIEPQVMQIANKAKTEVVPTHSLDDHGVRYVGADMDMDFDPNEYDYEANPKKPKPMMP